MVYNHKYVQNVRCKFLMYIEIMVKKQVERNKITNYLTWKLRPHICLYHNSYISQPKQYLVCFFNRIYLYDMHQ